MSISPPIRYFGSKTRAAPRILALVPPAVDTWVELFAGSAIVTLLKPPHRKEHINDLNGDVVNLFRVLRDDGQRRRLLGLLELTPYAHGEYLDCREVRRVGEPVEDARRFLVRQWQGMAGTQRKSTGFRAVDTSRKNAPAMWRELPARLAFTADRLQGVAIHQRCAIGLAARFADQERSLIFCDPPYPLAHINSHGECYEVVMTEDEHVQFAEVLAECSCRVILTMAQGTVYDRILDGWWRSPLPVQGQRNAVREEVIFANFEPPAQGLFDRGVA